MRARGYGLKGRTSYHNYFWRKRDAGMMSAVLVLLALVFAPMLAGYAEFRYYPALSAVNVSAPSIVCYAAVFALLFLTTAIEIKENIKWRYLVSRI